MPPCEEISQVNKIKIICWGNSGFDGTHVNGTISAIKGA